MFFGGIHQWVTALARQIEPIIQAFRDGGGVPQAAYDEITWDGQERFTNTWFESLLIHDSVKPRELLRSIRAALQPNGRYVCLEINAAETLEQNAGPLGSFLYGFSVLYCMTSSLAEHGEGLGTMGMPESKVRALCAEAGFSKVQRVPMENPFNSLYEVWP